MRKMHGFVEVKEMHCAVLRTNAMGLGGAYVQCVRAWAIPAQENAGLIDTVKLLCHVWHKNLVQDRLITYRRQALPSQENLNLADFVALEPQALANKLVKSYTLMSNELVTEEVA